MKSPSAAKLVRIYLNENDRSEGKPLYVELVRVLKEKGIIRVIVTRGKSGLGASGVIHGNHFWPIPGDFPVILECLDSAERISEVLPIIRSMLTQDTCTVIDGQIWK